MRALRWARFLPSIPLITRQRASKNWKRAQLNFSAMRTANASVPNRALSVIPEMTSRDQVCRPKGEHTLKGPAQTQFIGLELGDRQTPVEKRALSL